MSDFQCPCGGVNLGTRSASGTRCVKCGRRYQVWIGGRSEWLEDPAVRQVRRLYVEGQRHFQDLHWEIDQLKELIIDMRRYIPAWKKAQKRKALRRKDRESK